MDLIELKNNWDKLAKKDPLWFILKRKDKKGNKWEIDEFFLTGKHEIGNIMKNLNELNIKISYNKALDFGCGVGRLTQPLAQIFDEVYGIDISREMILLAKKYNKYPKKVKYFINNRENLSLFENNNFDFIYSNIVLQHMEPKYFLGYIKEFLRILKHEGIIIFQLPSNNKSLIRKITPKFLINLYREIKYNGIIEMYSFKKERLKRFIGKKGGIVIKTEEYLGYPYDNCYYYIRKENSK